MKNDKNDDATNDTIFLRFIQYTSDSQKMSGFGIIQYWFYRVYQNYILANLIITSRLSSHCDLSQNL